MFRSYSVLGLAVATLSLVAVGCGAVAESPTSAAAGTDDVRRCAAATAPVTRLDDVADGEVALGACGDLMFTKTDGSLWLRRASGDLVMLDEKGRPGAFDVTGTVATYDNEDGTRHVLFDLATLSKHQVEATIRLGYDEAERAPLAFACAGRDILVWNGSTFVARAIADRDLRCMAHAPFGATVMVQRDDGLAFVDVKRGTVRNAAAHYSVGTDDDGVDREDVVYLSCDGRVALYREVRQKPCGDTSCEEASGTDVIDTATGKVITHRPQGITRSAAGERYPLDRLGSLVMTFGSRSEVFSLDTKTMRFLELADTRIVDALDAQRFAYVKRDAKSITFATARSGSKDVSTIARLDAVPSTPALSVARDGKLAIYTEPKGCVLVPGTSSCQGAATSSDMVVWKDGKVAHRLPNLNAMSEVTFSDEGHALFFARWFTSDPPREAAYDTISFDEGIYALDASGALRKTSLTPTTAEWKMRAVSSRWLAREESAYDGRERTTTVTLYDREQDATRALLETTSHLEMLVTEDGAPAPGVLAYSALTEHGGQAPRTMSVWHGVP